MAILLAALAAKGETRISNIRQIDRGYDHVDDKLRELGAKIERVSDLSGEIDKTQEAHHIDR
jgi:UDP-N-acetylglucosamine 1-carboxyvinyltransferase